MRAGIAFSALVDALVLSLFARIPGIDLGQTAIVVGLVGLSSCVALGAHLLRVGPPGRTRRRMTGRLVLQAAVFGYPVVLGVQLARDPRATDHVTGLAVMTIVLFIVGIARAWQLIGARDRHLLAGLGESHRARSRGQVTPPGA